MKRLVGCVILMLAGVAAGAEPALERIRAQRAEAVAALAAKERECAGRFVVAACLESARLTHRETLARLRRDEMALDEARRRTAAEARRREQADKAAAAVGRGIESPDEPPQVRLRRARPQPLAEPQMLDRLAPPGAGPVAAPTTRNRASRRTPDRDAQQARHRAQYAARQSAAQARREAVEVRNQQRRLQGKTGAPLPLPAGER